jgi:hypothetical protein
MTGQRAMNRIEDQAAFYRGYLLGNCSPAPLATALATIVGLWLLVYVVSAIGGPEPNQEIVQVATHTPALAMPSP